MNFALTSVGTVAFSFWRPSRGPTSTIRTVSGISVFLRNDNEKWRTTDKSEDKLLNSLEEQFFVEYMTWLIDLYFRVLQIKWWFNDV